MITRMIKRQWITGAICAISSAIVMLTGGAVRSQAQTITGAGSTFAFPAIAKWTPIYKHLHGININYQPIGSGAGISQYKAGTVDFGATDAPLSNSEMKRMPGPTLHIPIVAGAEVLSYNLPGVGAGLRLTGPIIADIFLGKIKSWNDPRIRKLNPYMKLPNLSIQVMHRSDASGTTFIFTHYLSAVSPAWARQVGAGKSVSWPVGQGGPGNPGVTNLIRHAPGGIGYIELAYALQNHLPYGPIENRSGNFVLPTTANNQAALSTGVARMEKDIRSLVVNAPGINSYPIVGYSYALIAEYPKNKVKARETVNFLRWAVSEGQHYAAELKYVPMAPAVVHLALENLNKVKD